MCEGLQEKVLEEPGTNQQKDKAAGGSGGRGTRPRRVGEMHRDGAGERVDAEEPVRKANRAVGVFGLQGCLLFMEENRKIKLF